MISESQLDFFDIRVQRAEALVLATVYETEGSTYSKCGDQMLIDAEGVFRGLLSGGCLEGDLAVRARVVLDTEQAQTASYDFAADDDIWGLGVGCEGLMRIFLQPLLPARDWAPFRSMADAARRAERLAVATVIESNSASLPAGASSVVSDAGASGPDALRAVAHRALAERAAEYCSIEAGDTTVRVLARCIEPPPQLLILGAGLDAEPVVRFARELGWRCTIADHRPAYLESGDFSGASRLCVPAEELAVTLALSSFDFALVMSHHLPSDRAYLRQLAQSEIAYVGLLGPPARRERLLGELGSLADRLEKRLHGPVGLDIGGRGPAAIALSIIAQMQSLLASVR